jgi:hypothetical protein
MIWLQTAMIWLQTAMDLVANSDELFEVLERGQGAYIIVYKDNEPMEIFFAGYSFD